MSWLPSFPYPPSGEGYWSPVTSTLNWCEEDYYATTYSAEIVNSFTNLAFMFLAYKGISNCIQQGHDRVFLASFISYLVIGLGSFCFHSTLKYPMQLVDELSMIYTTCITFYATFSHGKSPQFAALLLLFLVCLATFITAYYHYLKDPLFHQNAFALLTAIVVFRNMYIMEANIRPKDRPLDESANAKDVAEQQRINRRDVETRRTMWKMIACGLSFIAAGFAIWNLDNAFCPTLRRWRRRLGLPWGILLEGHGWWHIMTSISAYYNLTWGIWLRHCLSNTYDEFELIWPSIITSVPVVVRRDKDALLKENEKVVKKTT